MIVITIVFEGLSSGSPGSEAAQLMAKTHEFAMRRLVIPHVAGADALRRGTCGTCRHYHAGQCANALAPQYALPYMSDDDGCVLYYAPTEPTEPTR